MPGRKPRSARGAGRTARQALERGREAFARRRWSQACRSFSEADRREPLGAADLERFATAVYLVGHEDEYVTLLARAHAAHRDAGEVERAARCAFWAGLSLLFRGQGGPAGGWLARAERILGRRSCAERGYLLLPVAERELAGGKTRAAHAAAARAASIGEKFGDTDLAAIARHVRGRVLLREGRLEAGLGLLDEAMVSVTAGELSPIVTGLVYCSVIQACQEAYAVDRAREWTAALTRWCETQPELVAFTTKCLVHRAEILQLAGDWPEAIEEARRACRRASSQATDRQGPPGAALYQEGEIHRLQGDFAAAERAYRSAGQRGFDPQPGLALLRLAQGRRGDARSAILRALEAAERPLDRARLLVAAVEILVATGDEADARRCERELAKTAKGIGSPALRAMATEARGAIALAGGDAKRALGSFRVARELWEELEAPHPAARARTASALACRALGDEEGCLLALAAARRVFENLGAAPDLARVDALVRPGRPARPQGLTPRELEVLRLVATGRTNRAIARELFVAEKTVDRHVSNVFAKLGVSSRAAATAYAYRHELV